MTGLEPVRLMSTRPSNVPVYQFQHTRVRSPSRFPSATLIIIQDTDRFVKDKCAYFSGKLKNIQDEKTDTRRYPFLVQMEGLEPSRPCEH